VAPATALLLLLLRACFIVVRQVSLSWVLYTARIAKGPWPWPWPWPWLKHSLGQHESLCQVWSWSAQPFGRPSATYGHIAFYYVDFRTQTLSVFLAILPHNFWSSTLGRTGGQNYSGRLGFLTDTFGHSMDTTFHTFDSYRAQRSIWFANTAVHSFLNLQDLFIAVYIHQDPTWLCLVGVYNVAERAVSQPAMAERLAMLSLNPSVIAVCIQPCCRCSKYGVNI